MFVLDTNVISELRQGKRNQSAEVRGWADINCKLLLRHSLTRPRCVLLALNR